MVSREEFYFNSRDGMSKIYAVQWKPEIEKPIFILQIIHGMAEYGLCYDDFANFLANHGVLVVANDHLGHGKSIGDDGIKGYFCRQDPATVVVRDVHRLKKMIQEQNKGVPYFILGHSMGSFILRNYLCCYGRGIDGAIIAGTGKQPKSMVTCGIFLTKFLTLFQGEKHKSEFTNIVAFGKNNSKINHPRTKMDWLTTDEKSVDAYIADPLRGFTFTLNGFRTLFTLIERLYDQTYLEKMPKNMPVLITAGEMDPVGNYGKWVRDVYNDFKEMEMENVSIKTYQGCRHELLNEVSKKIIYKDIFAWLKESTENQL